MDEPDFLRRTRDSYDAIAGEYAESARDDLAAKPLDRAVLAGFADLVRADGGGPVADVGCGPGRVTAHLDGLGLSAFGIDLSPRMIEVARRMHPGLRFEVGSMLALDVMDGSLGGLVAWYSTIHVPDDRLPEVFAGFHRVLAPGGYLQLAFQVGDETLHRADAFGQTISLDSRRRRPDRVAGLLGEAGLELRAQLLREPEGIEKTPQGFLLASKPALSGSPGG